MRVEIIETGLIFEMGMAPVTAVRGVVIHHTGAEDVDLSAAEIHQMHIGNGWAGIGYHKVFRKDGTVERGRPEEYQGAHCPGANRFTLGYHICGCFSGQLPNEAQLQALVASLADDCEKYGINPLEWFPDGHDLISGHCDWLATECPGDMLYSILPQIRQQVAEAVQQGTI
jgi:N-acetylmuramoyl-L-alanine amidase